MKLTLKRFSDNGKATLGLLFIDNGFACYTLENTFHINKIQGETRIPAGHYKLELRRVGGMVKKYDNDFKDHDGMLHLKEVPGFEYVYIHVGNTPKDTHGCILVGSTQTSNADRDGSVGMSRVAYENIYKRIHDAIENEYCYIQVIDEGAYNEKDCFIRFF